MYKLLSINDIPLPNPEGELSICQNDKLNEYQGEDGTSTIEVIREGVISMTVSYSNLTDKLLNEIMRALTLISKVELYNPMTCSIQVITARISDQTVKKIWYKNSMSVWSLTFKIDEL